MALTHLGMPLAIAQRGTHVAVARGLDRDHLHAPEQCETDVEAIKRVFGPNCHVAGMARPQNPQTTWPFRSEDVRVVGFYAAYRSGPVSVVVQLRTEPKDDGMSVPFCACGRRLTECDGSRKGCAR